MKKQKKILLFFLTATFLFANAKDIDNTLNAQTEKIAIKKGEILSKELELGALKAVNLPMPEASILIKNIISKNVYLGLKINDGIKILREANFNVKPIYEKIGDEKHSNPSYIFAIKKIGESGSIFKVSLNAYVKLYTKKDGVNEVISRVEAFADSPLP
ncbi:hypothetical protein [Massilia sp. YIM B04103]|uniref:hypothetical protein n=1 Tax=Massilia sp. YIM B04103 TaxID=2963106 RepID=UPI00210B02BA|nr:hypothetical protein [Massilia sp. YIM B04103]